MHNEVYCHFATMRNVKILQGVRDERNIQ